MRLRSFSGRNSLAGDCENDAMSEAGNIGQSRVCKNCGATAEEAYALPLCDACRDKCVKLPLPGWIRAVAVGVLAVTVLAFVRFPSTLMAGVAFERGQKAESTGNFKEAALQYGLVIRQFPESTLGLARMAISSYRAGMWKEAAEAFDKLGGRETSRELATEVNAALEDFNRQIKKQESIIAPDARTP